MRIPQGVYAMDAQCMSRHDYVTLVKDRAMWCEAKRRHAVSAGKTKKKEADDASETTTRRVRSIEEAGGTQVSGLLWGVRGTARPNITCDSRDSRSFPLHWRVGQCVTKTSLTNKPMIAAVGAPVQNDRCVSCAIFDVRIACVPFVVSDSYCLCSRFDF